MERGLVVKLLRYGGFGFCVVALVFMIAACFTPYYYKGSGGHFGILEYCVDGYGCYAIKPDCTTDLSFNLNGIIIPALTLDNCTDFNVFRAFIFLSWIFMFFGIVGHVV